MLLPSAATAITPSLAPSPRHTVDPNLRSLKNAQAHRATRRRPASKARPRREAERNDGDATLARCSRVLHRLLRSWRRCPSRRACRHPEKTRRHRRPTVAVVARAGAKPMHVQHRPTPADVRALPAPATLRRVTMRAVWETKRPGDVLRTPRGRHTNAGGSDAAPSYRGQVLPVRARSAPCGRERPSTGDVGA